MIQTARESQSSFNLVPQSVGFGVSSSPTRLDCTLPKSLALTNYAVPTRLLG